MKKRIGALVLVIAMLTVSGAYALTPTEFESMFTSNVNWYMNRTVKWDRTYSKQASLDLVNIECSTRINGSNIKFTLNGYTGWVYQACLTLPYRKMTVTGYNLVFSDEMAVYDSFYSTVLKEMYSFENEPSGIFSPLVIQGVLKSGGSYAGYGKNLGGGWKWVHNEPGHVEIKHMSGCIYEAKLLQTGDVWFNVELR